jgi:hypothetical protein
MAADTAFLQLLQCIPFTMMAGMGASFSGNCRWVVAAERGAGNDFSHQYIRFRVCCQRTGTARKIFSASCARRENKVAFLLGLGM